MRYTRLLIGILAGIAVGGLLSCQKKPADRLQYGLEETPSHTIVWVAVDKEMQFALAAAKAEEVIEKNENWEGTEFNVYYTLRTNGHRLPILVYGDVEKGIITAAYDNNPLDLEKGLFLVADKEDALRAMTQDEKDRWLPKP